MAQSKVLELKIDDLSKDDVFHLIDKGNTKVYKLNPEFIVRAKNEEKFKNLLNSESVNFCDGVGVQWAAKFLSLPLIKVPFLRQLQMFWQLTTTGISILVYPQYIKNPLENRFPGVELFYLMVSDSEELKKPIFLFGGEKKVLEKAVSNLEKRFPKLEIAGFHDGYNYKDEEIIKMINSSGAEILFVALGLPKQEFWIHENFDKLKSVRIAVGEGGTFDFVAGTFKRAPGWMRKIGLEWLFRLFANKSKTQTGNRARRVWNAVPLFILIVVKYKLKNK